MTDRSTPPTGVLERTTNPRLLAVIRIALGAIAALKGVALTFVTGISPGLTLPWIGLSAAVALGWGARAAAALLVLFGAYLMMQGVYWNHLYLLTLLLGLVVLSDSEQHHALLPRGSGDADAWPVFLMRCQLSIVYFFAAAGKVNGDFLSGDTLQHQFENALISLPDPGALLPLMSYGTIMVELFLALAVWSPRLRRFAFGIALPLHLAMLTISTNADDLIGITLFSLLMFTLLIAFVEAPERGRVVVWDDQCSFCRRWVEVVRRVDALAALRFVGLSHSEEYLPLGVSPERADRAIQLVEPDGRIREGYDAVRGIVSVIPGGHLVAPLMGLPGLPAIGDRVYRRVAARRSCRYEPSAAVEVDARTRS